MSEINNCLTCAYEPYWTPTGSGFCNYNPPVLPMGAKFKGPEIYKTGTGLVMILNTGAIVDCPAHQAKE